jgi:hypothetical protein
MHQSDRMMRQLRGTLREPDQRKAIANLAKTADPDLGDALGPAPSATLSRSHCVDIKFGLQSKDITPFTLSFTD